MTYFLKPCGCKYWNDGFVVIENVQCKCEEEEE